MSAKGKGKGKMYSNNVPAQVPSSSTKLHEGALDNSYYVQAKMKDGKWEKAKIIECRLSKDYDSKQTKTEDSYDYYVHYENYNRRMDEWVNRDRIQMTMDLIQGDEIYRDTERKLSMFEIDGHKNSTYCENLCYIAHLPLLIKKRLWEIPYFNELHCLSSRERQALRKDPWWTQAIIEFLRKNKDNEITMNAITRENRNQRFGYHLDFGTEIVSEIILLIHDRVNMYLAMWFILHNSLILKKDNEFSNIFLEANFTYIYIYQKKMIFIIFSFHKLASGQENNQETLVLEQTNPFYNEQFQMNQMTLKLILMHEALAFGLNTGLIKKFWNFIKSIQNLNHQRPKNVDTNQFETAYFLFNPLSANYMYHFTIQRKSNSNTFDIKYVNAYTSRYEGMWVYTRFQFIPKMSLIYVYFVTNGQLVTVSVNFPINKYGNKEIIIGGQGKIFSTYNLGTFYGRMSRPIMIQIEQVFKNTNEFWVHYNSCMAPKSCSGPTKIDVIQDQVHLDDNVYYTKTIQLYENGYIFGGWVKVDFLNVPNGSKMLLIRATINKDYKNNQLLGDRSFNIQYFIDVHGAQSDILVESYSYIIPQKGDIKTNGKTQNSEFYDTSSIVQDNIQQWHFVTLTQGIYYQTQRLEFFQIYFPKIQLQRYQYFFSQDIGANQFTTDYLYLHIGVDKYNYDTQFKGWIQDFQIWTCLNYNSLPIAMVCHSTCFQGGWCYPERKCEKCPINSHRIYFQITKYCECEEGYYSIQDQPICERFQDNYRYLVFSTSPLIKINECQLGYYQYQNQCFEWYNVVQQISPQKSDDLQISCLECIFNKAQWYVNPVCQTDYIKLIGNSDEPFYQNSRPINNIDLFKIHILNYLELCQGCYQYCDALSSECFLSNHYHLGNQMIVQCKQNYYFDQSKLFKIFHLDLLECHKCINNCEKCNLVGQCVQCAKKHYFDPKLQQCIQCDIRCDECQYDKLNQQICISCPEYFTLYNRKCLKCGVYCKFCKADHYKSSGEVYTRCYQCLDNKKYFISFDAINCHINIITNCIYAFQYSKDNRHVQTIDMMFEPTPLNSLIITACAKCNTRYKYVISDQVCLLYSDSYAEYSIQETPQSAVILLSAGYSNTDNSAIIENKVGTCYNVKNCQACILSKTYQLTRCSICDTGLYLDKLRGTCIQCPESLNNCLVCQQQQKINQDYFKLEFKAFYEWFVNFDGLHNYEDYAQSQNVEDFEIVCTTCYFGYKLIDGGCVKDCPENCAECIQQNGELQCLRCQESIQGSMLTLVNNECIQCPFNCAVCLPQDSNKLYQYNPYFSNLEYKYFTNLCLRIIYELSEVNYFYDPEIGNYIDCGQLQQCYQEVQFQMIVHCNDESYEQLLLLSANAIEFKQQNIKLSKLFSNEHEYQNDIIYMRLNQKSIKRINQTYIFTNISECVVSGDYTLKNKFNENVYSIKETQINLIGIDDNVKIYFSNQLYLQGYTHILLKNIEIISTILYPVNSIIISHLIDVQITLETIKFKAQQKNSAISLSVFNSSSLTINNCQVSNLNFLQNNFINIQNPLWYFSGLQNQYTQTIMKVTIENFSLLNCTFRDSSLINNILDNKFDYSFKHILIQAEFVNSFLITKLQTLKFSDKTIKLDNLTIQSTINDTDGFLNFLYINLVTVQSLTYQNSVINNSTFIKGNCKFELDHINFFKLQMIGNSILLKYEASDLASDKNIVISTLNIYESSYEQIHPFIYFVDLAVSNQLKLILLSLQGNYLSIQLQKSKQEMFYYSALIYIEMLNIYIENSNILRMPGFYEIALVNTQNITFLNLIINQKEPIRGLHEYLDCQQQQNYGNQYFSVISIFQAKYTLLNNIVVKNLILYNYPLIQYQSIELSRKIQSEILQITNFQFISNLILITQDIQSSAIIKLKSDQLIEIEISQIGFNQNQLNAYSIGKSIHACLINIQCQNGTLILNQLEAIDNLVTNSTNTLFYINIRTMKLKNSKFLRNNFFDYEKIKKNLMWSFPNNISQITTESLQNIFPIKSDGVFKIIFEVLTIDIVTISQAQGCKGGAFQLQSIQSGRVNISNSEFIEIRPSLNCDQGFGGALYIDCTQSTLIAEINQIKVNNVMSLNLGGFIYVLSAANELNITISHVEATNYQSLKGSFLYATLQYQQKIAQEVNIYNCSFSNEYSDFIEYLGYLSTFQNLDTQNLLNDRVQFFFTNGKFSMKQILINVLNYESFIYVSGCIQMDFSQLYFGGGNYSSNTLFNININALLDQKLNFEDISIQNLDFQENIPSSCKIQEFNVAKLTLLCQQNLNYNLPITLTNLISTEFLHDKGICYFNQGIKDMVWKQFSFIKISQTSNYHLIKMNKIKFINIQCDKCENGFLNVDFEQGLDNHLQMVDLDIFNSSCGTLGCLLLNQGTLDQQTLLSKNTRLLNNLEKDYYNMNFSLKIYRYTCRQNTANYGVCLFVHNIELQVIDSIFSNNNARNSGGAIITTNIEEKISFIRTIFENNSADSGNNIVSLNQILPNLTQTYSFSNYSKLHTNQLISVPEKLKITKSNHQYYQPNTIDSKNSTYELDLSILDLSFYFPNGQSLASFQYFDVKTEQYVKLNLSLRLVALNILDQEQSQITGTKCNIYSRMIQNQEDDIEFTQNYTNLKSIEFNTTTEDYNLDELILYFDSAQQETMFLQLQFTCNSIKVPVYLETDSYNINSWHDQYFLRTSLIKPLPCQIGEIIQIYTHVCQLCDSNSGLYSVKSNSNSCSSKDDLKMISVTSAQINLKQFYWRPYITSDFIENCFNLQENCKGSWQTGDESCFIGHIGALCEQCDLYNTRGGGQYSISSAYICGSCTSINQNILMIVLVSIYTLLSILISVKSTDELITDLMEWKKYMSTGILIANEKAMAGILIKILTNYLQIAGSLGTFKLQMPIWITSVIVTSSDPIQSISYSIDCLLIDMFNIPILYGRNIWHLIMVIIYMLAAIIIFYLISLISKQKLKQGIISTILIYTILFLQPNVIKKIYLGIKWVQGYVAYRYDSDVHQAWLPYLITLLISIGVLIPTYFFYKLFLIKDNLNHLANRSTWGFLYNEYTKWAYYWEIVKIILKEMIIIILIYYEDSIFLKAIIINLFILLYTHYLQKWKPYNIVFLNKLETLSSQTCSLSMLVGIGIYASQQQYIKEVQYPLFLILFIANALILKTIIFKIIFAYVNKYQVQIDELKEKIKQKFPLLLQKQPYLARLLVNKTKKKNIILSNFKRVVCKIIKQNQTHMKIAREFQDIK